MEIKPITELKITGFTLNITPADMDTLTLALRNSSMMLQSRIKMMNSCIVNGEVILNSPHQPNDDEFNLRATNNFLVVIDKVRSNLNESKKL